MLLADPARITPTALPVARGGVISWFLRQRLVVKLIGANVLIVLVAAVAVSFAHWPGANLWRVVLVCAIALAAALAANIGLVVLALAPLRGVETTARRVWAGDLAARVPGSPLADLETVRVGNTINLLLDGLLADRERVRTLAAQVIRAGDRERAALARELHDSTAQLLAGLVYQLSAAQRDAESSRQAEKLAELRAAASGILEEVRALAHSAHPRVLEDLGLLAALNALGRSMADPQGAVVDVSLCEGSESLVRTVPAESASVLYRVAQEAMRNALRHANARHVSISLCLVPGAATITISDDGNGFDLEAAERRRAGLGLFTMRERVMLIDGTFGIVTAPRKGTVVRAQITWDGDAPPAIPNLTSRASGLFEVATT